MSGEQAREREEEAVTSANRLLNSSHDDAPEPPGDAESEVTEANRRMADALEGDEGDDLARDAAVLNPPD